MKLLSSIKYLLLALPLALSFTACDDDATDPIVPGEAATGAQVYFAENTQTVSLSDGQTTIPFSVYRSNTAEAATVTISATVEAPAVFEVQTNVSFAAGERVAEGVINVNFDNIEEARSYAIFLNVPSGSDTPYGCPEMQMSITYENWKSLGTGTFFDGLLDLVYGYDAPKYEVEIQENGSVPGYFRVVNPYGPDTWGKHTSLDLSGTTWEDGDHYLYIHAEDPDGVYFEHQELGLDVDGSGYVQAWTQGWYYMLYNGETLEDEKGYAAVGTYDKTKGLIDLGKGNGWLYFENWGWYYTFGGYIKIVLPGFIAGEYNASIEYKGRFVNVDGSVQHVAQVEISDDVESAEVYLLRENSLASDVVTITESGEVSINMTTPQEPGNYTIVVDAYATGSIQASASEVIYYTPEAGSPFTVEQLLGTYNVDASYAYEDDICPTVTISESEDYPGWLIMSDLYFKGSQVWCYADYDAGILYVPNWSYIHADDSYNHYIYNWNGDYEGYFPMLMHTDGSLTMDSGSVVGIYSYAQDESWEGYWNYSYVFNLTKASDVVTDAVALMSRANTAERPCPNVSPAKGGRNVKHFGKPQLEKRR